MADDGGMTAALRRMVRTALRLDPGAELPRIDYLATYDAEVKAIAADGSTVDLEPKASHVKPINGVEVRLGVPAAVAIVEVGAIVKLGWVGGDPKQPYAEPSWKQGATVTKLVVNGTLIILGAEAGAQYVALANLVKAELQSVAAALLAHKHTGVTVGMGVTGPSDSTYTAGDVAATKVKAV